MKRIVTLWTIACLSFIHSYAQTGKILLFVSPEQTYYSEYIVMRQALVAAGYQVETRSVSARPASTYLTPYADLAAAANNLAGSSQTEFETQFQRLFGSAWNNTWNTVPATITTDGDIMDVTSMAEYRALVIAGGTGALDLRVDGNYAAVGSGARLLTAQQVQAAAEKLNELALLALQVGKPVLAQCHGASLPTFWRIPGTTGPGAETIGISLLKGQPSAGFPEAATATSLSSLGVLYRPEERVTIASPNAAWSGAGQGQSRILTTRDWYPQTVAHAAKTLLNLLGSYPDVTQQALSRSVLILHGGAVDVNNCGPGNRNNDVPCNYGTAAADLPADYTTLEALLQANSPNDAFQFNVSHVNLTGNSVPFVDSDFLSALNYFKGFQTIVFFKHWSTGLTNELLNALVKYADDGGGVLVIHHGVYNDVDAGQNKDSLLIKLVGVESAMNTWSGRLDSINLHLTNAGHFVTNYGVAPSLAVEAPGVWSQNALPTAANPTFSRLSAIRLRDEIYNNLIPLPNQTWGCGVNELCPLLSNDQSAAAQAHTAGVSKLFNPNQDTLVGRMVFLAPGERRANFSASTLYGQVVRNAAYWVAGFPTVVTAREPNASAYAQFQVYPNPASESVTVRLQEATATGAVQVLDIQGRLLQQQPLENGQARFTVSQMPAGVYLLRAQTERGMQTQRLVIQR